MMHVAVMNCWVGAWWWIWCDVGAFNVAMVVFGCGGGVRWR